LAGGKVNEHDTEEQVIEEEEIEESRGKWRGNVFVNDAGEPMGTCRGY
jgi:hypothetical protein